MLETENIISKLRQLKPEQMPLWGKMTPQHMVEHLYKTMQASMNEITLKIYTEEKRIPVMKRIFLGNRELPKEFMNPAVGPDLMKLEFDNLDTAINELERLMEKYDDFFIANPDAKTIHPVFGHLNGTEWDIFHNKHFKHHLSQFGLSD